jgi:hypothetical protein
VPQPTGKPNDERAEAGCIHVGGKVKDGDRDSRRKPHNSDMHEPGLPLGRGVDRVASAGLDLINSVADSVLSLFDGPTPETKKMKLPSPTRDKRKRRLRSRSGATRSGTTTGAGRLLSLA